MINDLINHAEFAVAKRESHNDSGFCKPYYPCVISVAMNNVYDLQPLTDALAFYWGSAFANAVSIENINLDCMTDEKKLSENFTQKCMSVLRQTRVFADLNHIYFIEIVDCSVFKNDDEFNDHLSASNKLSLENHTIHKILVMLYNHNQAVTDCIAKIISEKKKPVGFDTVFVLSDQLSNGGYESSNIKRMTDFMSIAAFNVDSCPNFRDALNGISGYVDSLLTISVRRLEKPTRDIALAYLYGITKAFIGKADERYINTIYEKDIKDLFVDRNEKIEIIDMLWSKISSSPNLPGEDLLSYLPFADNKLNIKDDNYDNFFKLAVKENLWKFVEKQIEDDSNNARRLFFNKLFSVLTFSALRESKNKRMIKDVLNKYIAKSIRVGKKYTDALESTKMHFNNHLIKFWIKELDDISPKLECINQILLDILSELETELSFSIMHPSIVTFYEKLAEEAVSKKINSIREKMIFCSGSKESLKKQILHILKEFSEECFSSDDVFALNYIDELNTRMKYVTSDEFNAVHFAAKEISDTSKNSIYFPSSGMVSLNTMKEILVIPNDQKLAAKLSQKMRPEDIIRIESHNNCVHISVVKISSGVYYSENPSNNGQS